MAFWKRWHFEDSLFFISSDQDVYLKVPTTSIFYLKRPKNILMKCQGSPLKVDTQWLRQSSHSSSVFSETVRSRCLVPPQLAVNITVHRHKLKACRLISKSEIQSTFPLPLLIPKFDSIIEYKVLVSKRGFNPLSCMPFSSVVQVKLLKVEDTLWVDLIILWLLVIFSTYVDVLGYNVVQDNVKLVSVRVSSLQLTFKSKRDESQGLASPRRPGFTFPNL